MNYKIWIWDMKKMPIKIWLTTNKRSLVCEESNGKSHILVTLVSACPTNKFKSIITTIYGKWAKNAVSEYTR